MAATETLPSTTEPPLTTDQLLLPNSFGPIAEIPESVSTQSVGIDIEISTTHEVLSSSTVTLEVEAPTKKQIERALGKMVGGAAFRYLLNRRDGFRDYYDLEVLWLLGSIELVKFATLLQAMDPELVLLSNGVLITLDESSIIPEF
ncbi:MAG: hypothetical protein JWO99_427 [Candidatus Saccharibacteria bacterium]|nr:hypothetical protein [Candidatus Saccharibacteria bacterium]